MAGNAFSVKVDITAINGLVDSLAGLDDDAFGRTVLAAVNNATQSVYDLALPRVNKTLNLTDSYVRSRMELKLATDPNRAVGQIIAVGTKPTYTQLARYDAKQLVAVAANRKGRAKGNAALGIAAGMKAAGVSVQVVRGNTKAVNVPGVFLMKLNRGDERGGNGYGVAVRKPGGKVRVLYGPSVYQTFKYVADQNLDESAAILEKDLLAEVDRMLEAKLRSTK